jgi:hypothetical protein
VVHIPALDYTTQKGDIVKTLLRFGVLTIVLLLLAFPEPVYAQNLVCGKVVVGGTFQLAEGDSLEGNLCLVGGVGILDPGSVIAGDVLLLGGTLSASGNIMGNIKAAGGVVTLGEESRIGGDVALLGGQVFGIEQADIEGKVTRNSSPPFSMHIPSRTWSTPFTFVRPVWEVFWLPLRSIIWAGVAALIYLLFPKQVDRLGLTAANQALAAGGVGLATSLVGLLASVFFAVTIICIPFSLIILLVFWIAWLVGMIGLGKELGNRIEKLSKQSWAPMITLCIGVFAITFIVNGFALAVPFFGWVVKILVGILGLGAVVLTRFGSQPYPQFVNIKGTETQSPLDIQPPNTAS